MKKALSMIICMLLCIQLPGTGVFSVDAESTKVLFEDDFSYTEFGAVGLYDENGAWEREYGNPKNSDDAGSVESTAPVVKDGVLKFKEGDGIRLNWKKLKGFVSEQFKSGTYAGAPMDEALNAFDSVLQENPNW